MRGVSNELTSLIKNLTCLIGMGGGNSPLKKTVYHYLQWYQNSTHMSRN